MAFVSSYLLCLLKYLAIIFACFSDFWKVIFTRYSYRLQQVLPHPLYPLVVELQRSPWHSSAASLNHLLLCYLATKEHN